MFILIDKLRFVLDSYGLSLLARREFLALASFLSLLAWPVDAQILPERSLNREQSVVNHFNENRIQIDGGAIRENNLFHSFSTFNVDLGSKVYFSNPEGVQSIFSRIIGGEASTIRGTLGVSGNASLFLLNPNGIIFRPGAMLDIKGSFLATTADSFVFDNGYAFSASNHLSPPLLTVNLPVGLQFGPNPGPIRALFDTVSMDLPSSLQVGSEMTLALVGGRLTLVGGASVEELNAPSGRVELGAVAENSFVRLNSLPRGFSLGYEDVESFRNISLSNGVAVTVSTDIYSLSPSNGDAPLSSGDIQVQGRRISLTDAAVLEAINLGDMDGGTIDVIASNSIELNDSSTSILSISPLEGGAPNDIRIETKKLILRSAFIETETSNFGQGGNLIIRATDSILVDGEGTLSQLSIETSGSGNAGRLEVYTGKLILKDGGQLDSSTISFGNGGALIIEARESVEISGVGTDGEEEFRSGLIAGVDELDIDGVSSSNEITGNGGNISIITPKLTIEDGGIVSATTESTNIENPGAGGNISITTKTITLAGEAGIATSSSGTGVSGNIELSETSTLILDKEAFISTEAINNAGGNITIQGNPIVLLDNNSTISTAASGAGNGGNIDITASIIAAFPGSDSDITASTLEGNGGNIDFTTQGLFGLVERSANNDDSTNDIDASSEFGVSGIVSIDTLETDPSIGLIDLPTIVVDTAGLVAQGCPSDTGGDVNDLGEFVITGRGGLPTSPEETLSQDTVLTEWVTRHPQLPPLPQAVKPQRSPLGSTTSTASPSPIIEAQGWVRQPDGKLVLTAKLPSPSIQSSRQPNQSCPSS